MANNGAKRFQWTPLMTIIAGLAVLVVGGWIFVTLHHSPHGIGATSVAGAPRAQRHGVSKTTPAYAAALNQQTLQQAQQAAHSGSTYIPPPAAQELSSPAILSLTASNPAPANTTGSGSSGNTATNTNTAAPIMIGNPQNQQTAPVPGLSPKGRAAKRDAAALKALMVRLRIPVPKTVVIQEKRQRKTRTAPTGTATSGHTVPAGGAQTLPANLVTVLRPGAMLYAENDLYLDSDSPGPVEVTILSGPLTGARALGTMAKTGDYLTLKFSSITTKAGTTYAIKGYGVNPKIPATTVRSAVDHHLLSRWGGLLAASFLQGYGQAVSQSGSTAASSFGSTITTMPVLTPQQELLVAAGTVGQQFANVMQQNFNRPATVTLNPGVPLAILILKG